MTSRIWNVTHSGVTGNITFDENGDRQVDFVLLDLDPEDNVYKVCNAVFVWQKYFLTSVSLRWFQSTTV